MKRLIVFSVFLFFLLLWCGALEKFPVASPSKTDSGHKNFYFLEAFSGDLRLMQLGSNGEAKDITPDGILRVNGAALSPSGNYIALSGGKSNIIIDAYSDPTALNPDIGIYILDTRTMKTKRVADLGYSPKWSLDEKWLYYKFQENKVMTGSDTTKDKVYAINLESQTIYTSDRLAENTSSTPTWLSARSSIVHTANTQENVSYARHKKTGIYIYDVLDQKGYFLLKSDELNYAYPLISPDGKFILYSVQKESERDLILSGLGEDISGYTIINQPGAFFGGPVWSNDSKYFLLHTSIMVGFNEEEASNAIYDTAGANYKEIKIDDWIISDMTWGETSNEVYILRVKPVKDPPFVQLVKYDVKRNKVSDVLYVTTNTIYFLSAY